MVLQEHSELELAGIRFQIGIFEEALVAQPDDSEALRYLSHAYAAVGRTADGLAIDRRLVKLFPREARVRYNLACSLALSDHAEEALKTLDEACRLGFDDATLLRKDRDLDSLREDPRFDAILERLA